MSNRLRYGKSDVDEVIEEQPQNNRSSTLSGRIMPPGFGPCGGANHGSNTSDIPTSRMTGMESADEIKKVVQQVSSKLCEHIHFTTYKSMQN
jgi:hypothetical protein